MRFNPFQKNPEKQRLPIIARMRRDAGFRGGRGEQGRVGPGRVGRGRQQVDAGMALECLGDRQPLPRPVGIGALPVPGQRRGPGRGLSPP